MNLIQELNFKFQTLENIMFGSINCKQKRQNVFYIVKEATVVYGFGQVKVPVILRFYCLIKIADRGLYNDFNCDIDSSVFNI